MLEPNLNLEVPPVEVLEAHGKSFYFASLVFSKTQRLQVAKLYSFCRYVDDCADEMAEEDSKVAIRQVHLEVNQSLSQNLTLQKMVLELEKLGVRRAYMNQLLKGAIFDVEKGQILSESDLITYCYRVAGVVGLMMCPLLGVRETSAYPFAIDLGIAMQLTNICRDIREDAQNERSYLPQAALDRFQLKTFQFLRGESDEDCLKEIVRKYLDLADEFYESGYRGLAYIPLRPRLCILLAGEVYRAIGKKIRSKDYRVLKGRVYLSTWEKIFVSLKTIPFLFRKNFWVRCKKHNNQWHHHLIGLPGVEGGDRVLS